MKWKFWGSDRQNENKQFLSISGEVKSDLIYLIRMYRKRANEWRRNSKIKQLNHEKKKITEILIIIFTKHTTQKHDSQCLYVRERVFIKYFV